MTIQGLRRVLKPASEGKGSGVSGSLRGLESGASQGSAAERLLQAVGGMWRSHGRAQMSARLVGQRAGVQASQINYYFGGFEQMLCSAQAQAIEAASQWCEARLMDLTPMDLSVAQGESFAHILAGLIEAWCTEAADLAFAWTECLLLAGRDPGYADAARQWQALWTRFFDALCARAGLSAHSALMRHFFYGEAFMHRLIWRPALDRAVLAESCVSWLRLLLSGEAGTTPLRACVQTEVCRYAPAVLVVGSVQAQIAEAAADLVEREGAAAVTHRAAAAAAGLTLGATTYHFSSSDALLGAAWAAIYARLTRPDANDTAPPSAEETVSRADFMAVMTHFFDNPQPQNHMRGMEELVSQAARDPNLSGVGAMIRYTRGQTTYLTLRRLPREGAAADRQTAALVSTWLQGLGRDLRGMTSAERAQAVHQHLSMMLDILKVSA